MIPVLKASEIVPLFDFVAVEPAERVQDVPEGLHLPDVAQDNTPVEGTIIAAGPEVKYVKAGMRVLYGRYAGSDVEIGGKTFTVMLESECKAELR